MAIATVGVIGLGTIGQGLMKALSGTEFALAVCDVRPEATAPYREIATVCANPSELGTLCDVVLGAVVSDEQVLDVLEGGTGALSTMQPKSTVVVISTISIGTLRTVAQHAASRSVGLVDCGVSGGPEAAAAGQWVSMVGGAHEAVEAASPVLDVFSSTVVRMGPLGAGMRAKLARQVVQFGSWLAAYEAQKLAEAVGVDLLKLAQVIRESDALIGGPTALMFRSTVAPFGDDDDAGLTAGMRNAAALAHKDLGAALALAAEFGVAVPLVALADAEIDNVFGVGS